MADRMSDEHYEEKFEFPLWKLIKQRAEEKDISYAKAAMEVCPEYQKTLRYRDTAFEEAAIKKRAEEQEQLAARQAAQAAKPGQTKK